MSGVKYVGLLLIILATCSNIRGDQLNSLCNLVKDGTMLTNPSSCASHYSCNGGVATLSECGANKAFNKDQQACIAASQTDCQLSNDDPCNGKVDTWVPNTFDCNAYYYCDKTSVAFATKCPKGQHFNADTNTCVYESESTCFDETTSEVENICLLLPNGVLFGNSSDCAAYSYCLNNELRSDNTCETLVPNTVYNVQTQACVYVSKYSCPQLRDAQPPQNGGACLIEDEKIAITLTNAPCNQYYECHEDNYILTTCAKKGEFYDTVSNECKEETSAKNDDCNRCTNHNDEFVASPTNPNEYYYCINSKPFSSTPAKCKEDLYFNQALQSCVSTDPEYPCCAL